MSAVRATSRADALIVVPPMSPSETNPPLGPALLASVAAQHGFDVRVIDLNIIYINEIESDVASRESQILGDHGKDRPLLQVASRQLFNSFGFQRDDTLYLPDVGDVTAGMHYSFETIERQLLEAAEPGSPLCGWIERHVFESSDWPSNLIGVSIMGPSQVFMSLLVLLLAKARNPDTTTVAGGSHVTLLAEQMKSDPRYCSRIDVVLPGHSEVDLVELLTARSRKGSFSARNQPRTGTRRLSTIHCSIPTSCIITNLRS